MKGSGVILVTRLNGSQFYINAEMIQVVESTPDTVISLTTETKVVVKENSEEVIRRIIEYKRLILATPIIKQQSTRRGA
jgi:flagellar protein FlbD